MKLLSDTQAHLQSADIEKSFKAISELAGEYGSTFIIAKMENRPEPPTSQVEDMICHFMASCNIFLRRQIPFHLWSDLAKEGLALLKEMIETGDFSYAENPKYKAFIERKHQRRREIEAIPEYSDRFQAG